MSQMSLDDLPPVTRTSDPDTSHNPPTERQRWTLAERLLEVIRQRPSTTEEAAAAAGIGHHPATKRISDLKNVEEIRDSGLRRKGSAGVEQIVWRATRRCTCQADDTGEGIDVNPDCDRHGVN